MNQPELQKIAHTLACENRGILAADESIKTAGKRLASIGLESTEETRRQYRNLFLTAPGIGKYLSGVIFFDETIRQNADDGRSFVEILQHEGIIPGIKVDGGLVDFVGHPGEELSKGLEGLPARLKEYYAMGARFTKWRTVAHIGDGIPTDECLNENAKTLTEYARVSQEAGMVPIVEPEVLLEGAHSMARAEEVTAKALHIVFQHLTEAHAYLPGLLLKSSMVVPGNKSGEPMIPEKVAEATVRCFKNAVPAEVAGIVFLSGGQTPEQATANLNAIAQIEKREKLPWGISFSYARALQGPPLAAWGGKPENILTAQQVFLKRLALTVAADRGEYQGE